jgi:hypothetical protein
LIAAGTFHEGENRAMREKSATCDFTPNWPERKAECLCAKIWARKFWATEAGMAEVLESWIPVQWWGWKNIGDACSGAATAAYYNQSG